jgi:tetratricopeptide (TPR) repeat protein
MTASTSESRRARALAACGRGLQALGLWGLARSAYQAALARDNRVAAWRYGLGLSLEHLGRLADAAQEYEDVLTRDEAALQVSAQTGIKRVLAKAMAQSSNATGTSAGRIKVAFMPAPSKGKNLASARIRCVYLARALNEYYAPSIEAVVGRADNPSVIVLSQTCTARTLVACALEKRQGARIIYDCSDPYAEHEGTVHGIAVAQRFKEIISIADAITVPTAIMRNLIAGQDPGVPIALVPDTVDYQEQTKSDIVPQTDSVVWFGNPGRGNLESSLWALRALKQRWSQAVTLITDPDKVGDANTFIVEPWAYENFVTRLRRHGLALVSQDKAASYKSENRYVVALINGVPAISTGSESIAALLRDTGFSTMQVNNEMELDRAMQLLSDPAFRNDYVIRMQDVIRKRFGPASVARTFVENVLHRALGFQISAPRVKEPS